MPSRRAVLAASGLALTGGLAGCNSAPPPPEPTFDRPQTAWPVAGYDPAGTGNPPAGPSEPTVAWRRSRDGFDPSLYGFISAPVVTDGTVYVAGIATRNSDGNDSTNGIAALDADSGDQEWRRTVPAALSGGPAVVGDPPGVVVGGRDGTLHAFDTEGTARWTVELRGRLGAPTVYGDRVYVADSTGRLYAVDADGTRAWTADRPGPRELLFGEDDPIETTLPVADGRGVYAAFTPFERDRDVTVLLAYRHDGSRRWRTTLPGRYGHEPGGMAVTEDALYVTVGSTVYAVDPESGSRRWQFVTGADTAGPPTTDGESVYVAAKNLYALRVADGTERWRVVNEAVPDLIGRETALPYLARPPVTSDRVYLRASAFATADGSRRWGGDANGWLDGGDYYTEWFYRRPMVRPAVTSDAVYLTHPFHGVMAFR